MNNRVINSYSASSFIYVIVGLIMMIVPGMINSSFGYFIGAICLFIGSIQIYSYIENRARVFNLVIGSLYAITAKTSNAAFDNVAFLLSVTIG